MNRCDFYNENEKAVSGNGPWWHNSWGRLMWVWGHGGHDSHDGSPHQASLAGSVMASWGTCSRDLGDSFLSDQLQPVGERRGWSMAMWLARLQRDIQKCQNGGLHWLGSLKAITVDPHTPWEEVGVSTDSWHRRQVLGGCDSGRSWGPAGCASEPGRKLVRLCAQSYHTTQRQGKAGEENEAKSPQNNTNRWKEIPCVLILEELILLNDYTMQGNLWIQWNPYQNTTAFFKFFHKKF